MRRKKQCRKRDKKKASCHRQTDAAVTDRVVSYPCHWAVAVFASLSIHSTHSANSRCCRIFFISHFIARRTFYSQCSVWNVDLVRCATTPVIPIYILIHRIVILDFISLFFCCVADSIRMTILFNCTEYKPDRFSFHFFFDFFFVSTLACLPYVLFLRRLCFMFPSGGGHSCTLFYRQSKFSYL